MVYCCSKGGKSVKDYRIKLEKGEIIKEVGEEGYKYLCNIERDKMNENQMKERSRKVFKENKHGIRSNRS